MAAALRAAGETAGAFARKHGLHEERVRRWVRRVQRQEPAAQRPVAGLVSVFAPVRVLESPATGDPTLEVVVGGAVVRVGRGFDEDLLQHVVTVLRSSAC